MEHRKWCAASRWSFPARWETRRRASSPAQTFCNTRSTRGNARQSTSKTSSRYGIVHEDDSWLVVKGRNSNLENWSIVNNWRDRKILGGRAGLCMWYFERGGLCSSRYFLSRELLCWTFGSFFDTALVTENDTWVWSELYCVKVWVFQRDVCVSDQVLRDLRFALLRKNNRISWVGAYCVEFWVAAFECWDILSCCSCVGGVLEFWVILCWNIWSFVIHKCNCCFWCWNISSSGIGTYERLYVWKKKNPSCGEVLKAWCSVGTTQLTWRFLWQVYILYMTGCHEI